MLGQRKLTTGEIQKHFDGFGLEPQFAEHTRMGALSGGQKVKVVLGAGLWNLPHIVILDEPTNFLDRDSLGALASAIKEFKGGIFMISHNGMSQPLTQPPTLTLTLIPNPNRYVLPSPLPQAEFYEALCPEKWILESGRLTVMGAEWMEEVTYPNANVKPNPDLNLTLTLTLSLSLTLNLTLTRRWRRLARRLKSSPSVL